MWREILGLGAFIVMFWNVENFFDPFDDPLKNDNEYTAAAVTRWTWSRFEKKRDLIGKSVIATASSTGTLPAIVALAEVENRLVARQLAAKGPLAELGYGYILRESPDPRGIDVALLYHKELFKPLVTDSLRVEGFDTRDILYVKGVARHSGDTLHILVNHWPSKRGGAAKSQPRRDAVKRLLEAFCDSLLQSDPRCLMIAVGDFNDTEPAVRPLKRCSPKPQTREIGGTLKYKGRWETIDHCFVSEAVEAEAEIFAPGFLLEEDKNYLGVKPRRTYIGRRYNGGVSDHLPVLLKIELCDPGSCDPQQ